MFKYEVKYEGNNMIDIQGIKLLIKIDCPLLTHLLMSISIYNKLIAVLDHRHLK